MPLAYPKMGIWAASSRERVLYAAGEPTDSRSFSSPSCSPHAAAASEPCRLRQPAAGYALAEISTSLGLR